MLNLRAAVGHLDIIIVFIIIFVVAFINVHADEIDGRLCKYIVVAVFGNGGKSPKPRLLLAALLFRKLAAVVIVMELVIESRHDFCR